MRKRSSSDNLSGVEEFRLGDQVIRYDREATATAYKGVASGDAGSVWLCLLP